jgi:hypothetical protein
VHKLKGLFGEEDDFFDFSKGTLYFIPLKNK